MKINNYNIRRKGLEPLIATILLIVVSVILVTVVLTWGKEFSISSLNKTNNFAELKASDATHFIYPKSAVDGMVQFTYSPPAEIKQDINVTHYRVINIPEMTEPIALSEPKILSPSLNILELPCLYEYSTTTPDLYIQLITADNTYIDIKTKDAGMVCSSGGTGTEEDPIIVCDAEDLNNVRNDLDANYALGKDIDLQCFSRLDVNGWAPIGDEGSSFNGNFNGLNHAINYLYIYRPTTDYVGLFGSTYTSEINNLNINDANITGKSYVGGLSGYSVDNTFSNISSNGSVNAYEYVGGLLGYSTFDNISNCHTSGAVIIYDNFGSYAGGLIGIFSEDQEGTLLNSYSTATVGSPSRTPAYLGGLIGYSSAERIEGCYATGDIYGTNYLGGLIGSSFMTSTIENCFATGEITFTQIGGNSGGLIGYFDGGDIKTSYAVYSILGDSQHNYVGGLIGRLYSGNISDCYSIGDISGDLFVGGLVGANDGSGEIITSYAAVIVSGSDIVGGLLGYNEYGAFNGSYWDFNISEQITSDGGEGKTTTEMKTQSTFTDWDFSTVWAIDSTKNDGYPYLRNNPPR